MKRKKRQTRKYRRGKIKRARRLVNSIAEQVKARLLGRPKLAKFKPHENIISYPDKIL